MEKADYLVWLFLCEGFHYGCITDYGITVRAWGLGFGIYSDR